MIKINLAHPRLTHPILFGRMEMLLRRIEAGERRIRYWSSWRAAWSYPPQLCAIMAALFESKQAKLRSVLGEEGERLLQYFREHEVVEFITRRER